jgi:hypothetical protein
MIRCHAHPCREPGHYLGTFQSPFCEACFNKLTAHKMQLVKSIASLSVLAPGARSTAIGIINECRRYLSTKQPQQRRTA